MLARRYCSASDVAYPISTFLFLCVNTEIISAVLKHHHYWHIIGRNLMFSVITNLIFIKTLRCAAAVVPCTGYLCSCFALHARLRWRNVIRRLQRPSWRDEDYMITWAERRCVLESETRVILVISSWWHSSLWQQPEQGEGHGHARDRQRVTISE